MDIVCFSDICWDSLWQRHQNIMTRFPHSWTILFIEPTSLIVLFRDPARIIPRRDNNILIVSLPTVPLIDRARRLRRINDLLILTWVRVFLKLQHIKAPILFYYEPRFSSLIGKLNEVLVVYDCVDDRPSFSGVPRWIKLYIDILVEKSDIIFVTSHNLYNKILEQRRDDVYLVGNGVDAEHFKMAMTDIPIAEDIKNLRRPIMGYIGTIDDWLDFDLIETIAFERPDISVVLMGPVLSRAKDSAKKLAKLKNVFFIGKRPYAVLPYYLKAFDVCIIPFKINNLTTCVNPVKLYEYLASGKNIVSTCLPELDMYKDIVFIAKDKLEFINMAEKALHIKPDINKISTIVDKNSWDEKADEMVKIISKYHIVFHSR